MNAAYYSYYSLGRESRESEGDGKKRRGREGETVLDGSLDGFKGLCLLQVVFIRSFW